MLFLIVWVLFKLIITIKIIIVLIFNFHRRREWRIPCSQVTRDKSFPQKLFRCRCIAVLYYWKIDFYLERSISRLGLLVDDFNHITAALAYQTWQIQWILLCPNLLWGVALSKQPYLVLSLQLTLTEPQPAMVKSCRPQPLRSLCYLFSPIATCCQCLC